MCPRKSERPSFWKRVKGYRETWTKEKEREKYVVDLEKRGENSSPLVSWSKKDDAEEKIEKKKKKVEENSTGKRTKRTKDPLRRGSRAAVAFRHEKHPH